jgi:hypothetical protein
LGGGGGVEKVSLEENMVLEADFSKVEIKLVTEGSYAEGTLGLDGFSFLSIKRSGLLLN